MFLGKYHLFDTFQEHNLWYVSVFDTLEDNTVTIRDRDTLAQTRVKINEL